MTRAHGALLAVVAVLGAVAHADMPAPVLITPPPGWRADVEQARLLSAKTNEVSHFGGAPALATAEVYVAPSSPATLHVTAIAAKVKDHREAAARVAVDSFHESPRRAQLASSKVVVDAWEEKVDAATKQIVAQLAWRDDESRTATTARLLIVADAENLVAITAECVTGEVTKPADKAACEKQLATLDTGIAADTRVPLSLAPVGTEPPPGPTAMGPKPGQRPAPTISDSGDRDPLPPMNIQGETKRTTDRRPVYVGLGIILLAALFWWNRRHRGRDDEGEKDTHD